jgi:PIN domain nuclease of toxin-antitoxin system
MGGGMMVVLDTSALVYWTLDPERLTAVACQTIDEADQIVLSAISLWEIGLKAKQGKLGLPLSIAAYAQKVQSLAKVTIEPVGVETWLKNLALEWAHRDPADRTIVATAVLHDCPLISSDHLIQQFYNQTIW